MLPVSAGTQIPSTRRKVGLKTPSPSPCASLGSSRPQRVVRGMPVPQSHPWVRSGLTASLSGEECRPSAGRAWAARPELSGRSGSSEAPWAWGCACGGSVPCEREGTRLALTAPWGTRGGGGRRWVRGCPGVGAWPGALRWLQRRESVFRPGFSGGDFAARRCLCAVGHTRDGLRFFVLWDGWVRVGADSGVGKLGDVMNFSVPALVKP